MTLGIDGTPTVRASRVRGVSRTVDQAVSGSTGDGSVSRYRPSQPVPCGASGSPVDQMSVPRKCERLEFGYPVRWMIASRPESKIDFNPASRGFKPRALPPRSVPICRTFAAGIAIESRRA